MTQKPAPAASRKASTVARPRGAAWIWIISGGNIAEKSVLKISQIKNGAARPLIAQARNQRRRSAACDLGSRCHRL
jgi:hypothetical protein